MKLTKKSFLGLVSAVALALAIAPGVAFAADPPTTAKELTPNGDGTYTLSLSVTGKSSSKTESSKADVIVVFDLSNSMNNNVSGDIYKANATGRYALVNGNYVSLYTRNNNRYTEVSNDNTSGTVYTRSGRAGNYTYTQYTGTRYSKTTGNRLAVAKTAVDDLAAELLGNNTTADPQKVRMSLVTFHSYARVAESGTYSLSSFQSTVDDLSVNWTGTRGGTNWEDALKVANGVSTREGADVYVIFVSDGDPTYRNTRDGSEYSWYDENDSHSSDSHTYYGSGSSDRNGKNFKWGLAEAKKIVNAGKKFYTVGTFGSVGNMQNLTTQAGAPAANYFSANDQEALALAFANIINEITNGLSYSDVKLTDGLTSMVSTTLMGNASDFTYKRSGGAYGTGETWTGAPAATYSNSQVSWDLGSMQLENGVTYTVSFKVWPSQAAYDLIADLNNGLKSYDTLPAAQKAQIVKSGNTYSLKTNTSAGVTYREVETVETKTKPSGWTKDGDVIDGYTYTYDSETGIYTGAKKSDPATSDIKSQPAVPLTTSKLTIEKKWADTVDPNRPTSITLRVLCDGSKYMDVTLTGPSWTKVIDEAPGIEADDAVLETGHTYTVQELGSDVTAKYDFTANPVSTHPMIEDGTLTPAGTAAVVSATNKLKAGDLKVTKTVAETTPAAPAGAKFAFTVTLTDKTISGKYGDMTFVKGVATFELAAGASATATGLPSGVGYEVTETNPDGFTQVSATNAKGTVAGGTTTTAAFTNKYTVKPVEATLDVEKALAGRDWLDADEFEFTLTAATEGAPMPAQGGDVVTITSSTTDHKASFGKIKFESAGTYEYTIAETTDLDGTGLTASGSITAKVTVTDNGKGQLVASVKYYDGTTEINAPAITNTYETTPAEATIDVVKALAGRDWLDADSFDFSLTAATTGAPMPDQGGDEATITSSTTDHKASFGTISYDEAGTYEYTIAETTDLDGTGLTCSGSITAKVTVTDNGTGALVASVAYYKGDSALRTPTITNTYETTPAEATIDVVKALAGRDWLDADSFAFSLTAATTGAPMPAAEGGATATITKSTPDYKASFGTISYDEAGTYEYTIAETTDLDGTGLTCSGSITAKVTVTDDNKGSLTASVKYYDTAELTSPTITNTYSATGTLTLDAEKLLQGREWTSSDAFTFALMEGETQIGTVKTATASSKTVTFDKITYDEPGSHLYTITETNTDLAEKGLVKSGDLQVSVSVVDDNEGHLVATPTYTLGKVITNTYSPTPAEATIDVVKALTGRDWLDADSFAFSLTAATTGAPMPAEGGATATITKSTPDYKASFGTISYDEAGTYSYTIAETTDLDGTGLTCSGSITAKVTVADDMAGTLSVSVKYYDGDTELTSPTITNTYETTPAEATLDVVKALTGRDWLDADSFDFSLTAATEGAPMPAAEGGDEATITSETTGYKASFGKIEFKKAGTYEYTIAETTDLDGTGLTCSGSITAKVTVADDNKGKLTASVKYYNGDTEIAVPLITNTYSADPATFQIPVSKKLEGRDWLDADEFTFGLTSVEGTPMPARGGETATIDGTMTEKTASFGTISFDEAGTYRYTITETNTDLAENGLEVTPASIIAVVVVEDNQKGSLEVSAVAYYKNEEADANVIDAAQFTNTYEAAPVTATLGVKKAVDDTSLSAAEAEATFEFTLTNTDLDYSGTASVSWTGSDEDVLEATFAPTIEFTEPGSYDFTLKEVEGDVPGFEYDNASHIITVTVEDNLKGELVATVSSKDEAFDGTTYEMTITNTYDPEDVPVSITAEKAVIDASGSAPYDEAFEFGLYDKEGKLLSKGTAMNGGSVTWSGSGEGALNDLLFSKVGTYGFYVQEIIPETKTPGFVYDENKYNVDVTVTDGHEGKLVAEIKYAGGGQKATITNEFVVDPTEVALNAEKVLEGVGEGMEAQTFDFVVTDIDGKTVSTGSVTGAGTVTFDPIPLTKVGTFTFYITEVEGSAPGYTYDPSVYTVQVYVERPEGLTELQVNAIIPSLDGEYVDDVVFTNKYEADPVSIYLTANKILIGKDLELGEFTFSVYDENDEVISTATNDETGFVEFGEIKYTEAGTHELIVKEDIGDEEGIEYDESEYTVVVTVTDNGEGKLVAELEGADDLTFRNVYEDNGEDPKPDPDPDPSPDTGDSTPLAALLGIMGIGALGMGAAAFGMRRREN